MLLEIAKTLPILQFFACEVDSLTLATLQLEPFVLITYSFI